MDMVAKNKKIVKEKQVMGIFLVQNFKKDSKGNWVETSKNLDKAPHAVGHWNISRGLDGTYVMTATMRDGLNKKVVRTSTCFDKEREIKNKIT